MALHSVRPPRRARLQVEGDDGLQERSWLLARFGEAAVSRVARGDARWFRVGLAERAVDEASRQIDGRRRKHRGAGVAAWDAAVVRKRVAPPQDATRLRVESNDRAAKGGTGPGRPGSGHAGVDRVPGKNGRSGHDPFRVRMHLRDPAKIPGLRVDPQHVRVPEIADHERVAGKRRTRAHDVASDPGIVRYHMRPDHLPGRGIEFPEHAAKVSEVHRFVHDCRRRRDIARSRRHPLHRQATRVRRFDRALERLIAAVGRIVADHSPVRSAADGGEYPRGAHQRGERNDLERDPRESRARPAHPVVWNRSTRHDSSLKFDLGTSLVAGRNSAGVNSGAGTWALATFAAAARFGPEC